MPVSVTPMARGIPSTISVADENLRRIINAIVENLRGVKVDAGGNVSIGGVSIGTGDGGGAKDLSLRNLGGGSPVGVSISNGRLTMRTVTAGTNITLSTNADGSLGIAAAGGAMGTDELVGVQAGDTPGWLNAKLQSAAFGAGIDVLTYGASLGSVKGIEGTSGIDATDGTTNVVLAIDDSYIEALFDHKVATDAADTAPGFLDAKMTDISSAGSAVYKGVNVTTHKAEFKGIAPGVMVGMTTGPADLLLDVDLTLVGSGISTASHKLLLNTGSAASDVILDQVSDVVTAGLPIAFLAYIQTLGTSTVDADTQSAVVLEAGSAVKRIAVHKHDNILGLDEIPTAMYTASEGSILYRNVTGWVVADLETLVNDMIDAHILDYPVDIEPIDGDQVFIRSGDSLAFAPAGECTPP